MRARIGLRLVVLVLVIVPFGAQAKGAAPKERKVLLQLDNVELATAVKTLSRQTGRNFIVPSDFRHRRLTVISATPVAVDAAIRAVRSALQADGLDLVEEDGFLRIARGKAAEAVTGAECPPVTWIRPVDDTTWILQKTEWDRQIRDTSDLATQARVIPHFENGGISGFKVFGIRKCSVYTRLGIRNGDTIRKVNGESIDSPSKALLVYEQMKNRSRFELELKRGDSIRTHVYKVE
jgi:hypothetical protein